MNARTTSPSLKNSAGFTIVELMVAMTISLMLLVALVGIFVNTSRSQNDMSSTNSLIDNGRYAIQIVEEDVVHAGFWGAYVPRFDNLSSAEIPGDAPTIVPDPCQVYASWDTPYRNGLLGIPVQASDALPTGAGCLAPVAHRAGTDVLVVRHADTCVPGSGNCEADVAGKVYFQPTSCALERAAGTAQLATSTSVTLAATASGISNAYVGTMLRTVSGTGAGQQRHISAYNAATKVAIVNTPWAVIPDNTTTYAFDYVLGTSVFPLHQRDCIGTGTPPSLPIASGTPADKLRLISNMYYITETPHPDRAGAVIPTLMRARFDVAGGAPVHLAPEALIEGIESFRVELGVDEVSDSGAPVDYTTAVNWADPTTRDSPTNRGDGVPDDFIRCTSTGPCTADQLANVVAVKLYLLVRSRDELTGHTDARSYCLGELAADGTCPAANTIAAANDGYQRHVFTTSIRLHNVSGRRETP